MSQYTREVPAALRLAVFIRGGFHCAYCGVDMRDFNPRDVTIDHLECQSKGGKHQQDNMIGACRPCNSSRKVKPWREYATGGAILRIENEIAQPLNVELAREIIRGNVA